MSYSFYMNDVLLPVPPSKLQTKIKNQNDTVTLVNDGEINILKSPGLTSIEFEILLPNVKYPFAVYNNGYKPASYYLDYLEKLKTGCKPFQFIVSRSLPNGKYLNGTNIKVSLEEYQIKEDAKNGFDVNVSIKLKQYRDYGTKTCNVVFKSSRPKASPPAPPRPVYRAPSPRTYKVRRGDCLWNISKRFYGSGKYYKKIYNANRGKIRRPNLIYAGQVLVIP